VEAKKGGRKGRGKKGGKKYPPPKRIPYPNYDMPSLGGVEEKRKKASSRIGGEEGDIDDSRNVYLSLDRRERGGKERESCDTCV